MPDIEKTRVSIFPIFSLEVTAATFLDQKTQEFVPMDISRKWISEKYAQNVFGDWCYPLKLSVAMCEQVITEEKVQKIIGLNVNACKYPLVMGNMNKWIKKDFEYYPVTANNMYPDTGFVQTLYLQLKNANPHLSRAEFIKKVPLAYSRAELARKMSEAYSKSLPLVKSPKLLKSFFRQSKLNLIKAQNIEDSKKSLSEFLEHIKKTKEKKNPRYRIMVTGDFATMILEFPLFDLDVFLAKYGAEIINPHFPSNFYEQNYSATIRKAKEILSEEFSNKHHKVKAEDRHLIELLTLYKIIKGLEKKPDGIIYIKPIMCSPSDNVEYIIKKRNNFSLPMLEISYDEHSGTNGIVTRLEAFMNILEEAKERRK